MTNEEKILSMLEKMDSRLERLEAGQGELKERVNVVESMARESADIMKAVSHRLDFVEAKIDGLQVTTASIKQMQDFKQRMSAKLAELSREIAN